MNVPDGEHMSVIHKREIVSKNELIRTNTYYIYILYVKRAVEDKENKNKINSQLIELKRERI